MAEPLIVWLAPGALEGRGGDAIPARWTGPGNEPCTGTLADVPPGMAVRLVLSVADVLVTEVALNRRQARHLQRVLPWLLEDQLVSLPERYWFVAGRPREGRYTTVACDREGLLALVSECTRLGLPLRGIAVDALLLATLSPACIHLDDDHTLILAGPAEALRVPSDQLADTLGVLGLAELPSSAPGLPALLTALQAGARSGQGVELLQGELRPAEESAGGGVSEPWKRSGWLTAACAALVGVLMLVQSAVYQSAATEQRARAASLYSELFPGDTATALLESQFRNRLARLGGGSQAGFAGLMGPVGDALAGGGGQGLSPRRIQYDERENALTLDVDAPDYDALEALRQRIADAGLEADIANYRSQGEQVTARLRVVMGS